MAPKKPVPTPKPVPTWIPMPDKAVDIVNVPLLVQHLMNVLRAVLGDDFASRAPLKIGSKGWSAPFDTEKGAQALAQTHAYQCAINIFWDKLLSELETASTNWRQVIYLADFYWNATKALTTTQNFVSNHFPHTIHAFIREPAQISTPLSWGVFDKIAGTEIMLAYAYALVCCAEKKDHVALQEMIQTALTAQCKFHVMADPSKLPLWRMQLTENISADNKALGFSALQACPLLAKNPAVFWGGARATGLDHLLLPSDFRNMLGIYMIH